MIEQITQDEAQASTIASKIARSFTADDQERYQRQLEQQATSLITEASHIQSLISTAKSHTKRSFYSKKLDKIRPSIQQTLTLIELIKLSKGTKTNVVAAE